MFLKIKSLWQKIKILFTNLGAFAILALGILIMAAGVGGACLIISKAVSVFITVLSIIISAVCGFIAGFIIAWAVQHFDFKSSSREMEKKLEEEHSNSRNLEKKLEEEQRKNENLSATLKKTEEDNAKLQHSLETTPTITRIQPVMKLVLGEVSFHGTDYCEKQLGDEIKETHLFFRKEHRTKKFYRGVYDYSGQAELRIDFSKIKVAETADEIKICGPFEYEQRIFSNLKESRWRMRGRLEEETQHGSSDEDMDIATIKVKKTNVPKMEDKQLELLHENIENRKFVEMMPPASEKLVFEFVKMMLAPTGKVITYDPTAAGSIPTRTLGELVADYNRRAALPGSQNVMNGYLENH